MTSMDMENEKGSITVFLSLTGILFLVLIFAITESARVQGAKAQSANITAMGTYSLLGEYEQGLLDKFNLFGLDGSYGSGSFQIDKVNERFEKFMAYNTSPKKDLGLLTLGSFDPWQLTLEDHEIEGYTLLTDGDGAAFYQEAVTYVKSNAAYFAINGLLALKDSFENADENSEKHDEAESSGKKDLAEAEKAEEERKQKEKEEAEQAAREAAEQGIILETEPETEEQPKLENPLGAIADFLGKGVYFVTANDLNISKEKFNTNSLPSHTITNKGTLPVENKNSGIVSDLCFKAYVLSYLSDFTSDEKDKGKAVTCQLEYAMWGKNNDRANVSRALEAILAIREGMNLTYAIRDEGIQKGCAAISSLVVIAPPVATVLCGVFVVVMSTIESFLDTKALIHGGRVPFVKTEDTWKMSPKQLLHIVEVFKADSSEYDTGLNYREYLMGIMLLNPFRSMKKLRLRTLDVIQLELQKRSGESNFRAQNCIVALKTRASFETGSVFGRVPQIMLGISQSSVGFTQKAGMAYW